MIVDVLNVQAGEILTEILETPASDDQVRFVSIHPYVICWSLFNHRMKKSILLGGVIICVLKHIASGNYTDENHFLGLLARVVKQPRLEWEDWRDRVNNFVSLLHLLTFNV